MRFCGHCGTRLPEEPPAAELRQITVLFCDLVGSTALADSLDPEDLRELTAEYHGVCSEVIARYDGHIAQYLGDGILVYFGYPKAHEDDARRGIRAALGILEGIRTLETKVARQRGVPLTVRLGIHTGPVVVGSVGGPDRREQLALGRTPNVAARVQSLAEPGTVVITDATFQLVRGLVETEPLGAHDLRGIAEQTVLHRVIRETDAETHLDVAMRSLAGLTPLTGRSTELSVLESEWQRASSGDGHAVLVRGEAGIGKSRIVATLRERVGRDEAIVVESVCSPYYQGSALFPVISMVERILGFARDTSDDEKRATLEARLKRRGIFSDESFALMAQLLSIPPVKGTPPLALPPQKQRERTLEILREWLLAITREQPVLWIVEDLHWSDPTTLEFISAVVARQSEARLLSVLTFRPEFEAPWHENGRVSSLTLSRLAPVDTTAMVARVAGNKPLPEELVRQLIERTEGVPLFIEEVTKAVLELGVLVERDDRYELSGPLPPDLIPSTVQGSLMARLDRLGSAKSVAQLAATIGREFRFDVLSAVASMDEDALRGNLARLLGAELVYRVTDGPDETYQFKHALIQDAAYQSVLKRTRREIHSRIADALTTQFSRVAENHPELLAEHLGRADRGGEAARQWLRAGQLAVVRGANHEGIAHLRRALEFLKDVGVDEDERDRFELDVLVALSPTLMQTQGWASAEVARVIARSNELLELVPDTPHRLPVLSIAQIFDFVGGRIGHAVALAEQVLELAYAIGNPALILVSNSSSCVAHFYAGKPREALARAEAGLALSTPDNERIVISLWGQAGNCSIYGYLSEGYWTLGYPDRAREASRLSSEAAEATGHLPSKTFAQGLRPEAFHLQGDVERTLFEANDSLRIAKEERFGFWIPTATVYRGWALFQKGEREQGLALMQEGLAQYRANGNGVNQERILCMIGEALWRCGREAEALQSLDEAMRLATELGEHFYEPELYRIRGEIQRRHDVAAAESDFRRALELAREQEARSLELRAAMSLCDLQRANGAPGDGRATLETVYGWFTEGFDTPDLRAARAMLDSTAPQSD